MTDAYNPLLGNAKFNLVLIVHTHTSELFSAATTSLGMYIWGCSSESRSSIDSPASHLTQGSACLWHLAHVFVCGCGERICRESAKAHEVLAWPYSNPNRDFRVLAERWASRHVSAETLSRTQDERYFGPNSNSSADAWNIIVLNDNATIGYRAITYALRATCSQTPQCLSPIWNNSRPAGQEAIPCAGYGNCSVVSTSLLFFCNSASNGHLPSCPFAIQRRTVINSHCRSKCINVPADRKSHPYNSTLTIFRLLLAICCPLANRCRSCSETPWPMHRTGSVSSISCVGLGSSLL